MKTLKFKKDSWHYWLASTMGPLKQWEETTDFCSYVRAVIIGAVLAGLVGALAVGAVCCVGDWLGWLAASIKAGYFIAFEPNSFRGAMLVNMALAMAAVLGAIISVCYLVSRMKRRREEINYARANELGDAYVEPPPSFIMHAYLTWKEKTCFKVEIS
jgi:hypothetical protein